MALPEFPSSLRPMIQSGKQRSLSSRIIQGEPPAFEQWTNEQVAAWKFKLIYSTADAATFRTFYQSNRGRWFKMGIRVEQGLLEHIIKFRSGFPQLASEQAGVLTYNCEVEARRIVRPIDTAELAPWAGSDLDLLDIAINVSWPEPVQFGIYSVVYDGFIVTYSDTEVLYG